MKQGLLWYDDSKTDFANKVHYAAQAYEEKYGKFPNECWVHLGAGNGIKEVAGVRIVESRLIQPDQFWIGRTNESGT